MHHATSIILPLPYIKPPLSLKHLHSPFTQAHTNPSSSLPPLPYPLKTVSASCPPTDRPARRVPSRKPQATVSLELDRYPSGTGVQGPRSNAKVLAGPTGVGVGSPFSWRTSQATFVSHRLLDPSRSWANPGSRGRMITAINGTNRPFSRNTKRERSGPVRATPAVAEIERVLCPAATPRRGERTDNAPGEKGTDRARIFQGQHERLGESHAAGARALARFGPRTKESERLG